MGGGYFLGVDKISNIFLGCLKFPKCVGSNCRCSAQAYVLRKNIEYPLPPTPGYQNPHPDPLICFPFFYFVSGDPSGFLGSVKNVYIITWEKPEILLYALINTSWIVMKDENNWAVAWDFQQCGILTCVDSDQPLQPHFKLRNSKWCSVCSLTIIENSSD